MRYLILSGGSGNTQLLKGLINNLKEDDEINILVNAYDSGKSTGICREVTNTLGVSDIRKNHYKIYEFLNDNIDQGLKDFYCTRYDISSEAKKQGISELEFVIKKLSDFNFNSIDLGFFMGICSSFFDNEKSKDYNYDNFSIANIVYSQMYSEYGYVYTNAFFSRFLGIRNCVFMNSYDNVYISAGTESGKLIGDEGDIVEWKNYDKINDIFYDGNADDHSLSKEAIDLVLSSDVIIISTGTFWSSIYPTLDYGDFYKLLNISNATKLWFINTEEDKDSYGVSSEDFIKVVKDLGLNVYDNFTIIENSDAKNSLRLRSAFSNIVYYPLGNNNGKNDSELLFECIKNELQL